MIRVKTKAFHGAMLAGLFAGFAATSAIADNITLRIGAGHPEGPVAYVRLTSEFFVPEVSRRVEEETDHTIRFIEAYGGTIAKLPEVLEATQRGILDIGHTCFCFEPTKAFAQNLNYYVPFTTPSAVQQLRVTRQVYAAHPQLSKHFADNYDQTLLALTGYDNYNLGTSFEWDTVDELAGHKIGGAGPNLPWLEGTGATVVQTSLNDMYSGVATGVFEGMLMFPGSYFGFKFHEVAPHYKVIDIGAVMVNGMMINNDTRDSLPPEVLTIIQEVAMEYEVKVAEALDEANAAGLARLEEAGTTVTVLPQDQRIAWAEKLAGWPNDMAQQLNEAGFDGSGIFRDYIRFLEEDGYTLPVRYEID
ncbi:C4-dicarboxylate TRAP transporter substrate-binding protein [Yoonia algicola]|uniref:C4-dicarboxylate TRAP transporter substrate-binding protein n=1 Tax=Yoonia algicola TaxID=3137368 RepID=A0AAN0M433_9RHOB